LPLPIEPDAAADSDMTLPDIEPEPSNDVLFFGPFGSAIAPVAASAINAVAAINVVFMVFSKLG
jgi:hypothetical protein